MRRHRLQAAQIFPGLVILVSSQQENAAFINAQRQSGKVQTVCCWQKESWRQGRPVLIVICSYESEKQ